MKRFTFLIIGWSCLALSVLAQGPIQRNVITTAVPFISIDGNAQIAAKAGIGVVAPELYTQNGLYQNPALLASESRKFGTQISYTPWLRIINDVALFETGIYYSPDEYTAIAVHAKCFSIGSIRVTDGGGDPTATTDVLEFSTGFKFAQRFSPNFSMGLGVTFIRSDFFSGSIPPRQEYRPGIALAADFGLYYENTLYKSERDELKLGLGLSIEDIGSKISYSATGSGDFIPQNLRIGALTTYSWNLSSNLSIAIDFAYQLDKLLVPTPPIYLRDPNGNIVRDASGNPVIEFGMDPDVGPVQGAIQSFYDAPGGRQEEFSEIIHKFGTEIRFVGFDRTSLLVLRGGHHIEHFLKGSRDYFSLGSGIGYHGVTLDYSHFISNLNWFVDGIWQVSLGIQLNLDADKPTRF